MDTITAKTPWAPFMGEIPMHLDYFEGSMFDKVAQIAEQYPNNVAFDFMGKSTTYKEMIRETERCAKALKTIGVREGDKVTIAMPNCPQAIYMFYAVNLVGGIANMIHPLSAEKEIEFYLNESESVTAITLDQFYHKFEAIRENTKVVNIIIASVKDALSKPVRTGYMLTEGRKIKKIPKEAPVIRWKEFMHLAEHCFYNYKVKRQSDDPAVILYSGGTTGTTKGIVLSNKNFNALSQQIVATNPMFRPGDKMLAAMPLFHGFGLGVCVHSMLAQGGRCILIPRFTAKSYAKQIVKYRCNFIAGVPTLYEALLRLLIIIALLLIVHIRGFLLELLLGIGNSLLHLAVCTLKIRMLAHDLTIIHHTHIRRPCCRHNAGTRLCERNGNNAPHKYQRNKDADNLYLSFLQLYHTNISFYPPKINP